MMMAFAAAAPPPPPPPPPPLLLPLLLLLHVSLYPAFFAHVAFPTPTQISRLFPSSPTPSGKIFSNGPMIGEKKDDDDAGSGGAAVKPLDKSAVLQVILETQTTKYKTQTASADASNFLQEVRAFNDPQIDARRCVELIGSLLRLISRGDVLTANECQDVFFGSTKLFQCPDERLRRMVPTPLELLPILCIK
jgi:hypothetical protein